MRQARTISWNERLVISVPSSEQNIRLDVYDAGEEPEGSKKRGKHIGTALMPMTDLGQGTTNVALTNDAGKAGTLQVMTEWQEKEATGESGGDGEAQDEGARMGRVPPHELPRAVGEGHGRRPAVADVERERLLHRHRARPAAGARIGAVRARESRPTRARLGCQPQVQILHEEARMHGPARRHGGGLAVLAADVQAKVECGPVLLYGWGKRRWRARRFSPGGSAALFGVRYLIFSSE